MNILKDSYNIITGPLSKLLKMVENDKILCHELYNME